MENNYLGRGIGAGLYICTGRGFIEMLIVFISRNLELMTCLNSLSSKSFTMKFLLITSAVVTSAFGLNAQRQIFPMRSVLPAIYIDKSLSLAHARSIVPRGLRQINSLVYANLRRQCIVILFKLPGK
jgi:hypothetical protein